MVCMPYIKTSTNVTISDEKAANLKNKIGKAIPFIIPKRDIPLLFAINFARQIGTRMFSIIRSSEFKYRPALIGNAICDIAGNNLCGLCGVAEVMLSFLKSIL